MRSVLLAAVLLTAACGSPEAKSCTTEQTAVTAAQAAKTKADADLEAAIDKVTRAQADQAAADDVMNKADDAAKALADVKQKLDSCKG